jgi:hypothetical protein
MIVFRGRKTPQTDLERRLRSERPEPSPELVAAVAARIPDIPPAARSLRRPALALATVGAVAVVFASLGGVGYASSAARQAVRKIETVVQSKSTTRGAIPLSAGQQQYGPVPVPPYPPPKPTPPPSPTPPPAPSPPPAGGAGGGTSGGGGTQGQGHGQSGGSQNPGSTTGVAGQSNGQKQGSGLPFTGMSLLLPVVLAILLVGGGIFLRRRARDLS